MTTAHRRTLLLSLALLVAAATTYRLAVADEGHAGLSELAPGTYLVLHGENGGEARLLENPSAAVIGGRAFLRGIVSEKPNDYVRESDFAGREVFVPLDRVTLVQALDRD